MAIGCHILAPMYRFLYRRWWRFKSISLIKFISFPRFNGEWSKSYSPHTVYLVCQFTKSIEHNHLRWTWSSNIHLWRSNFFSLLIDLLQQNCNTQIRAERVRIKNRANISSGQLNQIHGQFNFIIAIVSFLFLPPESQYACARGCSCCYR